MKLQKKKNSYNFLTLKKPPSFLISFENKDEENNFYGNNRREFYNSTKIKLVNHSTQFHDEQYDFIKKQQNTKKHEYGEGEEDEVGDEDEDVQQMNLATKNKYVFKNTPNYFEKLNRNKEGKRARRKKKSQYEKEKKENGIDQELEEEEEDKESNQISQELKINTSLSKIKIIDHRFSSFFNEHNNQSPLKQGLLPSDEQSKIQLVSLPKFVIVEILSNLCVFDLVNFSKASKACLAYSNNEDLWKILCERDLDHNSKIIFFFFFKLKKNTKKKKSLFEKKE